MLLQSIGFFMPVYFQAVLGASSLQAGIDLLPTTITVVPFGIVAGILIDHTGLLSTLVADSNKAAWICFQIISAGGGGIIATSTLPSILAALPESDVATASGAYSFVRSFGYIWGLTLSSIVFNGQFDKDFGSIGDAGVQAQLANGAAYGYASEGYVQPLPAGIKEQVVGVYVYALQTVWHVTIAFACFGFLCVFAERHVELRKDLNTEYGLEEKQDGMNSLEAGRSNVSAEKGERRPTTGVTTEPEGEYIAADSERQSEGAKLK
ncbi:MAG: hypothetical protein Q9217_001817 [Psora testacea]